MTPAILVTEYDALWPRVFEGIKIALDRALVNVDVDSIEHVGSTSVPGLAAKPIIDIDIVVPEDEVRHAIDALVAVGYEELGDMGIPLRYGLRAPAGAPRQNVYVVVRDCLALRNHLALRSVLRSNDALRDEYGSVKLQLAQRVGDIDQYIDGKTPVVQRILRAAGLDHDELAAIEEANRA